MIELNLDIDIPFLWGTQHFIKENVGGLNIIVGPNGTGKSLIAEKIKKLLIQKNFRVRLFNSERLFGLERKSYEVFSHSYISSGLDISKFSNYSKAATNDGLSTDAFITLKNNLSVKIKVESLLSDIFKKNIVLSEKGGFLKPVVVDLNLKEEYDLKENECHGLKELITILTFLYDSENNCIILDEPELHLHPQFQSFLMGEIRNLSGNPRIDEAKKLFFIITHSPYFIDLKTIEDLKNLIVCHYNKVPSFIDSLDDNDELRLKKFFPRFNTHHKQFFFSPNPIFVEGYTDQQILTIICERISKNLGVAGSCIIDVGGKDELDVFYRLCKKLDINGRFITDLDTIFFGKLRQTISNEEKCRLFLRENGIGINALREIGSQEQILNEIAEQLIQSNFQDCELNNFILTLKKINLEGDIQKKRYIAYLIIINKYEELIQIIPELKEKIDLVIGKLNKIINAFELCNVFILKKGEIENYFTQSKFETPSDEPNINNFEKEREYLLLSEKEIIEKEYIDLINIINTAIPPLNINLKNHLRYALIKWLQQIQLGIEKGEITSLDNLKKSPSYEYNFYGQVFDVKELIIENNKKYSGKIQIKPTILSDLINIDFNNEINPISCTL